MSYSLSNDAELPPAPRLPGLSENAYRRLGRWLSVLTGLVMLAALLWWARGVYTDLLWFDLLGFRAVYVRILLFKTSLFAAGCLVSGAVLFLNLRWAWAIASGASTLDLPPHFLRLLRFAAVSTAILIALIGCVVSAAPRRGGGRRFCFISTSCPSGSSTRNSATTPPFTWLPCVCFTFCKAGCWGWRYCPSGFAAAMYAAAYSIRGAGIILAPRMFRHAAGLGVFLMLTIAAGHGLDVFELALSDRGVVFGATYTDVHARIPALWLMTGIASLAAAGFAVSVWHGGPRLMIGAFSLWVIAFLLAGLAYPPLFQRFRVDPNEFDRERMYIERNIAATRWAYELDKVTEVTYPSTARLRPGALAENRETIDNIRLWDLQPMEDAYNQLQFMEWYYNFLNMDSDRYVVDGRLRQTLIAARELNSENLPAEAQNWVNRTLQYTHGYGVAMSPANSSTPGEGRPEFLLQDIPISGAFAVTRPEIYYGESPIPFVIVNSSLPEVDPDAGFRGYEGDGGVALSSRLRRMAYAWQFGDMNIMLSDQLTPESRIQYRRAIRDRVKAAAPFLHLDTDPYPALDGAGKLWWLQDAYTLTDRMPYSTRREEGVNYIRNSVKAVVDAYNGSVRFYAVQPEDPLLRMYRRAFPGMFLELEEMPEDLRLHVRYPAGLFSAQADMYLRYHVTDPQVFFNQAEQWAIPSETRFGKEGVKMRPAYMVLKPPGEEREEFVLMAPFTPAGEKKNLVGWLMARNDGAQLRATGELRPAQRPAGGRAGAGGGEDRERPADFPAVHFVGGGRVENHPGATAGHPYRRLDSLRGTAVPAIGSAGLPGVEERSSWPTGGAW